MPSAAGGRTRPINPATAMMVATYGRINRNWLGIGVLRVCKLGCHLGDETEEQAHDRGVHRVPAAHDQGGQAR
jgi:hypothetical protein